MFRVYNNLTRSNKTTQKRKAGNDMNELFKAEIKEADQKLYNKGFYISNMTEPYNDEFEIYDKDSNVVIDHLSVAQLIQLSNMI